MNEKVDKLPRIEIPNERNTGPHSLFSYEHCCICGKKTQVTHTRWLILFRDDSGRAEYAIPDPSVLTPEELAKHVSIWVAPIGADCLRRNPALNPYLLDRRNTEVITRGDQKGEGAR